MIPISLFTVVCPGDFKIISLAEIGCLHCCFCSLFLVIHRYFRIEIFTLSYFNFLSPLIISETLVNLVLDILGIKLMTVIMSKTAWPGEVGLLFFFFSLTVSHLHAYAVRCIWERSEMSGISSLKGKWWVLLVQPRGSQRGTVSVVIVWNDQNKKASSCWVSFLAPVCLSFCWLSCSHALYSDLGGFREGN